MGGRAAARLSAQLSSAVSAMTLLRLIAPCPKALPSTQGLTLNK
ncbi:hypothetical protein [Acrocarpospora phusangensis]|nr:hypothetical protein [Acrocarpospora phusangensis]